MNFKTLNIANTKSLMLFIISVVIIMLSTNTGLFWDNVLFVSVMGKPLFENGIFCFNMIPLESDPGHPPFIASYMPLSWKLFGKSLTTSHWAMLPFIFGFLWQINRFISFFIHNEWAKFGIFILLIADPTLLSQLFLINPEIIQLFFFFLALNATLRNMLFLKAISLAFLGIISFRGMMLCAGIFLIDFALSFVNNDKKENNFFTLKNLITYTIAATPAVIYILWRLKTRGFITSNPSETFGNAWSYNSIQDFMTNIAYNIAILSHRIIDFGRITLVLFVLFGLYIKRKQIDWKELKPLLIILILSNIVIYTTSILIKNPMGHRYFIVMYLMIAFIAYLLINQYKHKKTIYIILLCSLILGNFIVYPRNIAQGWDASLAHLPYWRLRSEALEYLDKNDIPLSETSTFFPNYGQVDNVDLNNDKREISMFSGNEKYVIYSNVYNLDNKELELINTQYKTIKTFTKRKVRVDILEHF